MARTFFHSAQSTSASSSRGLTIWSSRIYAWPSDWHMPTHSTWDICSCKQGEGRQGTWILWCIPRIYFTWWKRSFKNISQHLHSCMGGWSRPWGMAPRYKVHRAVKNEKMSGPLAGIFFWLTLYIVSVLETFVCKLLVHITRVSVTLVRIYKPFVVLPFYSWTSIASDHGTMYFILQHIRGFVDDCVSLWASALARQWFALLNLLICNSSRWHEFTLLRIHQSQSVSSRARDSSFQAGLSLTFFLRTIEEIELIWTELIHYNYCDTGQICF